MRHVRRRASSAPTIAASAVPITAPTTIPTTAATPMSSPQDTYQHFVQTLGRAHSSLHGDGTDVLGRILIVCEQMLQDRGCRTVCRADDLVSCITSPTPIFLGREGPTDYDLYIVAEERIGIKAARGILAATQDDAHVIVVSLEGATSFTRKECDGKNIQFMCVRDVCVNKTRHHLVPKHVAVPPPCDVDAQHLPRIVETAPSVHFPRGGVRASARRGVHAY